MKTLRKFDQGLPPSAREAGRRSYVRVGAFAFSVLGMALTVAANAQTGTGYGLGANGAPAAGDYLTAGNGFASAIGPILTTLLPLLLGMLAVWQGPRIVKTLVKKFSS